MADLLTTHRAHRLQACVHVLGLDVDEVLARVATPEISSKKDHLQSSLRAGSKGRSDRSKPEATMR